METAICFDNLFDQALVLGEGRPSLSAILVLNSERWIRVARELDLDPFERESLNEDLLQKKVLARVQAQLHDFPGYARVRRAILTLDPWTVENGLLTPTLKLKRNLVLERFAAEIEALYS
jgi:long-chain acyl-CoA synthetase